MAQSEIVVTLKFAWWVKPFVNVALAAISCGAPLNRDALAQFIMDRGVRLSS